VIGGALGYWALPVSALPQVDFPTVQVTTQLPGVVRRRLLITAPLERQLGRSVAVVGHVDQFVRVSPDFPAVRSQPRHRRRHQDVQAASRRRQDLQRTLPYPPTYAKVNPPTRP
jgi:multidrug efflux pump